MDLVLAGLPAWAAAVVAVVVVVFVFSAVGFLVVCALLAASLGGLVISSFSCLLLAELAVGRISLAREESSTGLELGTLAREVGLSWEDEECCGAREAREPCLRTVVEVVFVVVADGAEGLDEPVVRGAEERKDDGLRLRG